MSIKTRKRSILLNSRIFFTRTGICFARKRPPLAVEPDRPPGRQSSCSYPVLRFIQIAMPVPSFVPTLYVLTTNIIRQACQAAAGVTYPKVDIHRPHVPSLQIDGRQPRSTVFPYFLEHRNALIEAAHFLQATRCPLGSKMLYSGLSPIRPEILRLRGG